jgi:hypothetical protein
MDVDFSTNQPVHGKVLLYTSKEKTAEPTMSMMGEVGNQLPPVLDKLAGRYSPIQSVFINSVLFYFNYPSSSLIVTSLCLRTIYGLLRVIFQKPCKMMTHCSDKQHQMEIQPYHC